MSAPAISQPMANPRRSVRSPERRQAGGGFAQPQQVHQDELAAPKAPRATSAATIKPTSAQAAKKAVEDEDGGHGNHNLIDWELPACRLADDLGRRAVYLSLPACLTFRFDGVSPQCYRATRGSPRRRAALWPVQQGD